MTTVQMFAFNAAIAKELKERVAVLARDGINSKFIPSAYQNKIFDFISSGHGSCIVKAVAGSGKTTTCINSLAFIKGCDLTKDVAASTFHSAGFSALMRFFNCSFAGMDVRGDKVTRLLRQELPEEEFEMYGSFVARLIGLAKGEGFGALVPADETSWARLISHHDLNLDHQDASEEQAIVYARAFLRRSNEVAKADRLIDFDDQLYLPLLWKLKLWQKDIVYIDEAQDTNPVRRALAKLALRPGGRLIAVGDDCQAIYGFTGASHDAMDLIRKEFNCIELPLTVSYRCAKAIVREAQKTVPYIEAHDDAPEGEVVTTDLKTALAKLTQSDAILCRNTAPLIALAFKLIAQGRGCHVLGREIGANLVNMIKRQKAKGLPNLMDKLNAYREREVTKFMAKGEEGRAEALQDRFECIQTVADALNENERTVPALIAKIEGLFDEKGHTLQLGTMHKSKGREWSNVVIYQPELCPSKFARQEHQVVQEYNLLYVGRTRARLWLGYVS